MSAISVQPFSAITCRETSGASLCEALQKTVFLDAAVRHELTDHHNSPMEELLHSRSSELQSHYISRGVCRYSVAEHQ